MSNGLTVKNKTIGEGQPLICVPVMEATAEDCIREITYLTGSRADMIEWRVDAFEQYDDYNTVREVLTAVAPLLSEKLFLFTFRTKKQGGEKEIAKEKLDDLHDVAAESGCVDFIDLEFFEEEHPLRKIHHLKAQGVKIIASHHDFEETPPTEVMQMLLERMCAGGADIVKLAVMPQKKKDVLNLLEVTTAFHEANRDTPVITMSMGSLGCISRVSGETFGSCVTFGAHKKASAPGQLDMDDLGKMLAVLHDAIG
jgi:3-dehydroquinate dehydratase-1